MKKRKALFLDRDGIINIDHGYVSKIEDFEFIEGIFSLIKHFIQKNYLIFILTNQSGIGRGYYTIEDFNTLTQWMTIQFKKENITIEKISFCPHTPEDLCQCRKPKIGMLVEILKSYDINLYQSWLIGDKQSDIDLALNSNIANSISIGATKTKSNTYHFNSILECDTFIQNNMGSILVQ